MIAELKRLASEVREGWLDEFTPSDRDRHDTSWHDPLERKLFALLAAIDAMPDEDDAAHWLRVKAERDAAESAARELRNELDRSLADLDEAQSACIELQEELDHTRSAALRDRIHQVVSLFPPYDGTGRVRLDFDGEEIREVLAVMEAAARIVSPPVSHAEPHVTTTSATSDGAAPVLLLNGALAPPDGLVVVWRHTCPNEARQVTRLYAQDAKCLNCDAHGPVWRQRQENK